MGFFSQWFDAFPTEDRFLFVYGSSERLVDFVLYQEAKYRREFGFNVVILDETDHKSVCDVVLQNDVLDEKKAFIFLSYDKVKNKSFLVKFFESTQHHMIIKSTSKNPDFKSGTLAKIIDYGKKIRCTSMKDHEGFVRRNLKCFGNAPSVLVDMCGGNLLQMIQEIEKLQVLDVPVTEQMVKDYCCSTNWDRFFDDLMTLDKKTLLVHYSGSDINLRTCLEFVKNNLRLVCYLLPLRRRRVVYRELAAQYGVSDYVIQKYFTGIVNTVSVDKIRRWMGIIVDTQDRLNTGAQEGLLERMIVKW